MTEEELKGLLGNLIDSIVKPIKDIINKPSLVPQDPFNPILPLLGKK